MQLTDVLQLVNTGGVIGLLIFFSWAFYNGEIVSKKTLDKILESYQHQIRESISEVLGEVKKRGRW